MDEEKQPKDQGVPADAEFQGSVDGDQETEADELTLMKAQMDEALREKDQFRGLAQRAQADLENYKKRASSEQEEVRRNANSRIILRMLSVVDDLGRAMEHIPKDSAGASWLEGLELVQRNIEGIMESEGVSRIEAEGQAFEPREHEAIFYEEKEGVEEGTVISVFREGYKHHDRVLRAAQVTVSKAPEENDQSQTESTQQEAN